MKGVVLAGGSGTRLRPMTSVVNKHVLPVYDQPMIYHPVETLIEGGISDIMVISTPDDIGRYVRLLDGEFSVNFTYRVQKDPTGIAHALNLAEDFVEDSVAVMLGDNIISSTISEPLQEFRESDEMARIFLKKVEHPSSYGVADIDTDGAIVGLVEKPDEPDTNYAVIGLYIYDQQVFDRISELEPSERGEYEITDVNRAFLKRGELGHSFIEGEWFDVGTPEGLFKASRFVRDEGIERDGS